jgi:hypothetical protein
MKIDKLDRMLNVVMSDKKGGPDKAGGNDFQKILEGIQAHQTGEKQRVAGSGSVLKTGEIPEGPLSVYSLPPLPEPGSPFPSRTRSLQAADRMLRVLEEYQAGLADSAVPLKTLDPLIQALSSEIRGVDPDAENLPPNDPLKRILDEVRILAAVETERFNRGDYVS